MQGEHIGIVIGRFQPFHFGHIWLIQKALEKFEKVIILIGSSNKNDSNNPWSLDMRKQMLHKFVQEQNLENRIIKISELKDLPDDNEWFNLVIEKIGTNNFTIVGDNEWVNQIFEAKGYEVFRIGYYNRDVYEGTKIRELFHHKKDLKKSVPSYVVSILEN